MSGESQRRIFYPDQLPAMVTSNVKAWMIEYLCERMRDDEVEQYMTLTGATEFNPLTAALGFLNQKGPSLCFLDEKGEPHCAGGYAMDPVFPGVWQSWMVGSLDGWNKHWKAITLASKWMIRQLMDGGAIRVETTVLGRRRRAIEWYERSLGLKYEGTRRFVTNNGDDLVLYGLTKEDWEAMEEMNDGRRRQQCTTGSGSA